KRSTPGLVVLLASVALAFGACSRRADIVDEPDPLLGSGVSAGATLVEVDAGLADPALPACASREQSGTCSNGGDFPCDFSAWLREYSALCQVESGCKTQGWVAADVADNGCIERVQMSDPNADFIACLGRAARVTRCPCTATTARTFLIPDRSACTATTGAVCGPAEFPCREGEQCIDGTCQAVGGGAGSH
ncbi:MAG TPA: hypothetical protein VFQ61_22630, partial [Polyangiaceae bacterium]|nr:hypothetical protein [Polyangiaceae bacterium]